MKRKRFQRRADHRDLERDGRRGDGGRGLPPARDQRDRRHPGADRLRRGDRARRQERDPIVEFAKQAEEAGAHRYVAAVQAARMRMRAILMTSFAFILGVVPLLIASGAGAEMRQSLGPAVFFGMLGVTLFRLLFTPVFYVVCRRLGRRQKARSAAGVT